VRSSLYRLVPNCCNRQYLAEKRGGIDRHLEHFPFPILQTILAPK
jgi:hypothetical protein